MCFCNLCFATDIVEGVHNKGIFLDCDNGGLVLYFGNYQNSCVSDLNLCALDGKCSAFHMLHFQFCLEQCAKILENFSEKHMKGCPKHFQVRQFYRDDGKVCFQERNKNIVSNSFSK